MNVLWSILIPALIALLSTSWIYPYLLKVALEKNIVDNPDARKLQRVPVPVMGGLTVVFGIMAGIMSFKYFGSFYDMFPTFAAIIIIMIIGFIDDTISLSPKIKLCAEIILVLYIMIVSDTQICNFHGLWGLTTIPEYVSIPLTIFACVGIINAINLIDGVDGYSSGFTIISCILLSTLFYSIDNIRMATLSIIVASSLIPFFIGDAGTLSLGLIFSIFVINILSTYPQETSLDSNLGIVPFTLAVLCVPVFDTVRVMIMRIIRKRSPFSADKTHLHHLFITLGFSHFGTTTSIIGINMLVILCWYVAYKIGWSIDIQLYIVVALGILITFVFYPITQWHIRHESRVYHILHKIGLKTQITNCSSWIKLQRFVDSTTNRNIKKIS